MLYPNCIGGQQKRERRRLIKLVVINPRNNPYATHSNNSWCRAFSGYIRAIPKNDKFAALAINNATPMYNYCKNWFLLCQETIKRDRYTQLLLPHGCHVTNSFPASWQANIDTSTPILLIILFFYQAIKLRIKYPYVIPAPLIVI